MLTETLVYQTLPAVAQGWIQFPRPFPPIDIDATQLERTAMVRAIRLADEIAYAPRITLKP